MSSKVAMHNTYSALLAGAIAFLTYEVVYFLTSNHQVRSGLYGAAVIGLITFVIAFALGVIFRQIFGSRS